jgi:hypothetical protein
MRVVSQSGGAGVLKEETKGGKTLGHWRRTWLTSGMVQKVSDLARKMGEMMRVHRCFDA